MRVPFKKNITLLTLMICLHISLISGQDKLPQIQLEKNQVNTAYVETKIDSIIAVLTLEEKIGLTHAQSKFSTKGVSRLGIPEVWMRPSSNPVRPIRQGHPSQCCKDNPDHPAKPAQVHSGYPSGPSGRASYMWLRSMWLHCIMWLHSIDPMWLHCTMFPYHTQ